MRTDTYHRNHVAEAIKEICSNAVAVRRDRKGDASASNPDLFEKRKDGVHTRADFNAGDHVGTLTLVRRLTDKPFRNGHQWLCRCDCGRGERIVRSHYLAHSVRVGREPGCDACMRERSVKRFEANRELVNEAYRRQFVDYQTLWLPSQVWRLQELVRSDLEAEFGPLEEKLPSLRFGSFEAWPNWRETRRRSTAQDADDLPIAPPAARPAKPWKKPKALFGPGGPNDKDLDRIRRRRVEPDPIDAALERAQLTLPEPKPKRGRRRSSPEDVLCPCESGLPTIVCHGAEPVTVAKEAGKEARLAPRSSPPPGARPYTGRSLPAWYRNLPSWAFGDVAFPVPPVGHVLIYSTTSGFAYVQRSAFEALPSARTIGRLRTRITGADAVDVPVLDVAIALTGGT